jgi:Fic family protein
MKHILNDLSEQEKNSIREQHTGGMKVMTESFSKLINSKLGDSKPLVSEQTALGRLGNTMEITGQLVKNVTNILPNNILANMAKSAISGDVKTFNQVLDQEKARLGQDYTKLKNALTQGDVAKNLKNIGAELQPYINQMKSGMGNQPSNTPTGGTVQYPDREKFRQELIKKRNATAVKEDMDVSSDSEYYQERKREVSIPFDDLSMLSSLASRFCEGKENFPDCKQVRRIISRHSLFM